MSQISANYMLDRLIFGTGVGDDPAFGDYTLSQAYTAQLSQLDDRGAGESLPHYRTWNELRQIWRLSRATVARNEFAINGLLNRKNYVIGNGFKYTLVPKPKPGQKIDRRTSSQHPIAQQAKRIIDRFIDENAWSEMERESLERMDVDGDCFIRWEVNDSRIYARFLQPEWVYSHLSDSDPRVSYGVISDPDRIETVFGFSVIERPWMDWHPTFVDAQSITHMKQGTRRTAKRGLPLYYPVLENLRRIEKLLRNASIVCQARASYAVLRKWKMTSKATLEQMNQDNADWTTTDPWSGRTKNVRNHEPGEIADIPENCDLELPNFNIGGSDQREILDMELRAVGARLLMPPAMFSADSSQGNFASSMAAETPAVKNFEALQHYLARMLGRSIWWNPTENRYNYAAKTGAMWRVLYHAVKMGELPSEVLTDWDLEVTGPNLTMRDRVQETNRNKTLNDAGILSKAEWADREDLDFAELEPEIDQERMKESQQSGGEQGGAPPDMGGPPEGGGGGLPGEGGGPINDTPTPEASGLTVEDIFTESRSAVALLEGDCIPNKTGDRHHDSETGFPCSPNGAKGSGSVDTGGVANVDTSGTEITPDSDPESIETAVKSSLIARADAFVGNVAESIASRVSDVQEDLATKYNLEALPEGQSLGDIAGVNDRVDEFLDELREYWTSVADDMSSEILGVIQDYQTDIKDDPENIEELSQGLKDSVAEIQESYQKPVRESMEEFRADPSLAESFGLMEQVATELDGLPDSDELREAMEAQQEELSGEMRLLSDDALYMTVMQHVVNDTEDQLFRMVDSGGDEQRDRIQQLVDAANNVYGWAYAANVDPLTSEGWEFAQAALQDELNEPVQGELDAINDVWEAEGFPMRVEWDSEQGQTRVSMLEGNFLEGNCVPNKVGTGHHDDETGHPCKVGEGGQEIGAGKEVPGKRAATAAKRQLSADKAFEIVTQIAMGGDIASEEQIEQLAEAFSGLTTRQLAEVKRVLGVRAGGRKDDMVQKLAQAVNEDAVQIRARARQVATENEVSPADVEFLAGQIREVHNEGVENVNAARRRMAELFANQMGTLGPDEKRKRLTLSRNAFRSGDYTKLDRWDGIARVVAGEFPGLFPPGQNVSQQAFDLFAAGPQVPMGVADSYEQAVSALASPDSSMEPISDPSPEPSSELTSEPLRVDPSQIESLVDAADDAESLADRISILGNLDTTIADAYGQQGVMERINNGMFRALTPIARGIDEAKQNYGDDWREFAGETLGEALSRAQERQSGMLDELRAEGHGQVADLFEKHLSQVHSDLSSELAFASEGVPISSPGSRSDSSSKPGSSSNLGSGSEAGSNGSSSVTGGLGKSKGDSDQSSVDRGVEYRKSQRKAMRDYFDRAKQSETKSTPKQRAEARRKKRKKR